MTIHKIKINRAPVLTLWAVVVAQQLGYDRDAALTLGKAVAGLNAQSKGRSWGIFKPGEKPAEKEKGRKKAGTKGWGAPGDLDLSRIAALSRRNRKG